MKARLAKKVIDSKQSPKLLTSRRWVKAHQVWMRRCRRAVMCARGAWLAGSQEKRSGRLWEIVAKTVIAALQASETQETREKFVEAIYASPLLSRHITVRWPNGGAA